MVLPGVTSAQVQGSGSLAGGNAENSGFANFLINTLEFINAVLIPFLIGVGFLVFVFGMFWYFIAGGADEDKRAKGRSLMIYAVLGFVLIVVFWGIINLLSATLFPDSAIDELENVPRVDSMRQAP